MDDNTAVVVLALIVACAVVAGNWITAKYKHIDKE